MTLCNSEVHMEKSKGFKCHPRELGFAALGLQHYASPNLLYPSHAGQMHSVDN